MLTHELEGSIAVLRAIARILSQPPGTVRGASSDLARALITESERLGMLADDARILRGKPRRWPPAWQDFDPAQSLMAIRDHALRLQPERNIVFEPPATSFQIHGCPIRLDQVLRNLIDNALRYTPQSTPIELRLRQHRGPDCWVELQVVDHGPGIPDADAERVFLPYVRTATSDGVAGSGLGLALCQNLVTSMGGRIACSPTPGGGATFIVTLPCQVSEAEGGTGTA
jgi:signal transduction histidine kinase